MLIAIYHFHVKMVSRGKGNQPSVRRHTYDGQRYKQKIAVLNDSKGSMDGEILPGNKLRGEMAYEVPVNAKNLVMWAEVPVKLDTAMFAVSIK